MFETMIAGSLPKPASLARPRMLWPRWQLEGEALIEAKRDATLLMLKKQEDAGICPHRRDQPFGPMMFTIGDD
jgi:5-methyltetrahydropteroyltriglutamate--homocysteine methyltransferase